MAITLLNLSIGATFETAPVSSLEIEDPGESCSYTDSPRKIRLFLLSVLTTEPLRLPEQSPRSKKELQLSELQ